MESNLTPIATPSVQPEVAGEYGHQAEAQLGATLTEEALIKMHWNAALPVAQLPPETLAAIFMACVAAAQEQYYAVRSIDVQPYSWLSISHVCRYWRHVALGCPQLWSWIVKSSDEFTRLLLERSATAPLTIDTRSVPSIRGGRLHYCEWSRSALDAVYDHWPRIQEADVEISTMERGNIHAPLLHRMKVTHDGNLNGPPDGPPIFLAGGAASLRELVWYSRGSGYVRWPVLQPLLGSQLEKLSICLPRPDPSMSVDAWLSVLRKMRNLRTLSLEGAVSVSTAPHWELNPQLIGLPRLSDLNLITTKASSKGRGIQSCSELRLLASIDVPGDACIRIVLRSDLCNTDVDALTAISTRACAVNADELTLKIGVDLWPCTWELSRRTGNGRPSAHDGRPQASIVLQASERVSDRALVRLASGLSWSTITSMRLSCVCEYIKDRDMLTIGRDVCAPTFRTMANLKTLFVQGSYAAGIFYLALERLTGSRGNINVATDPPSCVLPSLRDCTFDGVSWREDRSLVLRRGLTVRLATVLATHRGLGAQLQTIRITNAENILLWDVDYIRARDCAAVVEWDAEKRSDM